MKTENPKGSTSEPRCTCIAEGSGKCKFPHPCRQCYSYHPGVSCYWHSQGKTPADKKPGRTFELSNGNLGCAECCNGDRCDDASHHSRDNCPFCLGSGTNATLKLAPQPATLSPDPNIGFGLCQYCRSPLEVWDQNPDYIVCTKCSYRRWNEMRPTPPCCTGGKPKPVAAPEPADQSSTGKELVWMDESHGRWAVFVGNVFCGYELSEERAKDKVAALLEAIQESIAAPMEAFTAEPAQSSSGCCANSWGSCSPAVVTTGFTVTIKFHTADADRALLSPDLVRRRIGAVLDTCGNIQEEIDYTLEVTRNYD